MKYSQLILLFICIPFFTVSQKVDMDLFHGITPRNIGPAGMSGRVTAIDVVLNDPDQIYIGAAAGGIWKSENAGHTWIPIFENEMTSSIGDIQIYQKNPNIIYVGTGEGNPRNSINSGWGMYKSIDGGRSWQHIGLEETRQIHRVIIHPDNPDIVYAGVEGSPWGLHKERGVYKTSDGGVSWEQVLFVNEKTGVADMVIDPSNPNKIFVAMWEHFRDPWFFKSGGAGSGLYMTLDGGKTWKQLTPQDGLPKGELGRIGLSVAPSNPDFVYAYIESNENAVYRSEDGGFSWKRRSKKGEDIGGRPFYYADIYVDTKNENRLYSIATEVTVSDDGGTTWDVFAAGNAIHTDHHAWWSHPDDPEYIWIGNDGGIHITHDRGEKWWFVENLPLAQFYHMRVDNEVPYNVYGGLQDNGSWVGPSATWFKGGIRNMYWQRLSVGDGFDVVPDLMDSNFGYAMGQSGNLVRYDRQSGQLRRIKPVHPEGKYLRFNWNAGIGINPHDKKTIYYGSQFVHKSDDFGQSWEIISPDLTTNNPEKQKYLESGGLNYDVTGAEFHTTIVTIAPSPVEENVIWVGTDDGQVQLTRNGGSDWNNVTMAIKGVPDATWVPHIEPSHFNAGEAYVVLDDHRRNNWTPYVYQTNDFGKSWTRMVDENDVDRFVYCITEDPIEPNLLFCGTDVGLYVSFDKGQNWNRWTNELPTMPVSDLIVHPREHDLVIGTFGRSFWIVDDIRPLRALAKESGGIEATFQSFDSPGAILAKIGESIGYRDGKVGDVLYGGENREYGALISYYVKDANEKDSVLIEISNASGEVVRNLIHTPKSGMNRFAWDLSRNGVRSPNRTKPEKRSYPRGKSVLPGDYNVQMTFKNQVAQTAVQVSADPRIQVSEVEMKKKDQLIRDHDDQVQKVTEVADQIRSVKESLQFVEKKLNKQNVKGLKTLVEAALDELSKIEEEFNPKPRPGIYRDPAILNSVLRQTDYMLDDVLSPAGENVLNQMRLEKEKCALFIQAYDTFVSTHLIPLKAKVKEADISIF